MKIGVRLIMSLVCRVHKPGQFELLVDCVVQGTYGMVDVGWGQMPVHLRSARGLTDYISDRDKQGARSVEAFNELLLPFRRRFCQKFKEVINININNEVFGSSRHSTLC